jgi:hypothetical protein
MYKTIYFGGIGLSFPYGLRGTSTEKVAKTAVAFQPSSFWVDRIIERNLKNFISSNNKSDHRLAYNILWVLGGLVSVREG